VRNRLKINYAIVNAQSVLKLSFKFVGSTIIYNYLQAVGVVNDHIESCAFK
jgi:DNA-3-methyladenine glycosylase I